VADLRRHDDRAEAGHDGRPADLADRDLARQLAARLRSDPTCRGLLVPSLAFADQPSRGNLVVFADRLRDGVARWLGTPTVVATVDLA